jgi:hypothetical protein
MCSLPHWQSTRPTLLATSNSRRTWESPRNLQGTARAALVLALFWLIGLSLGACQSPGDTPSVIKIGVIAPFEGVGRPLGYAILPAIKGELESANQGGALSHYRVALVALNDDLDPGEAVLQARALAQDPDVRAVLGLWSDETARAAMPILAEAGIPIVSPVPYEELEPGSASLCPTIDQIAAELLREAKRLSGSEVVLAGSDNALRRALLALDPGLTVIGEATASPCSGGDVSDCGVLYSGDAVGAAAALRRWKASGWEGSIVGGPEVARPWLIEMAEGSAEGTRAVVCGSQSLRSPDGDISLENAAELAAVASRTILTGVERAIAEKGAPSRQALTEWISTGRIEGGMTWIAVSDGQWVPARE